MSKKPRNDHDFAPVTLDDFLREWSTDPMPKYVNPKCSDSKGHECKVCGDRYLLESSLRRHLARKTFLARLPCRTCRICHLAFNRCALILRAQRCKLKATSATLSSLPPDEALVPLQIPDQDDADVKVFSQDAPMTTLEKVLQNTACSECSVELEDAAAREDHFHASRGNLLRCGECTMVCTSECALKAHKRLHAQRRPFVCPECGIRTNKAWAVFERHVSMHCHHYERIVGYHCQLCPALLLEQGELAGHIVDTHSNALHKCQACPMAFVTLDSFHNHRRNVHPKLRSQCWIILKCPLCEAVFASSDLLTSHVGGHLERCGRSLFRCAECDSLQPTRSDLVSHVRKCHPGLHDANNLLEDREDSAVGMTVISAAEQVIELLEDDAKSDEIEVRETEPTETPLRKGKPGAFPPRNTPSSTPSKRRKSSTDIEEERQEGERRREEPQKTHSCAKCPFTTRNTAEFRDHIAEHRPRDADCFQCPECGLCYVVEPSLRKHLRSVHRINEEEEKSGAGPQGASVGEHQCTVCLAAFDTERELKSHSRTHGMAFLRKVANKEST